MTTRELFNGFKREDGIALFNAKKTDKEIYDILVAKGLTDDYETFTVEAQKVFSEKVSKMSKDEILAQIEGAELTDEQLEQIAGGKLDNEQDKKNAKTAGIVTGVAATAGIGCAIMIACDIVAPAACAALF